MLSTIDAVHGNLVGSVQSLTSCPESQIRTMLKLSPFIRFVAMIIFTLYRFAYNKECLFKSSWSR